MNADAEALDEDYEDDLDDESFDDEEGEQAPAHAPTLTLVPALVEPKDDEESLTDILTRVSRPGWKPDISKLKDAIVDGSLMVPVGGRLLIQYPAEWQDTACFKVCAIDPPDAITCQKGYVRLWDPNKMQFAMTNYITGPEQGLVFKVPDEKRRWVPGEGEDMRTRRRRRRRRALVKDEAEKPVVPVTLDAEGNPVKRKRGRPKGSKNKSTLEREAKEKSNG